MSENIQPKELLQKAPILNELVGVISGQDEHQQQFVALKHPMYEPNKQKVYVFINADRKSLEDCNKSIRHLFHQAGLGAISIPYFSYRGVCMFFMPERDDWDYPTAVFAHFLVTNLEKIIAIRGADFLTQRLTAQLSQDCIPTYYQCLNALDHNLSNEGHASSSSFQQQSQNSHIIQRKWKSIDFKHPELKSLSKKFKKLV